MRRSRRVVKRKASKRKKLTNGALAAGTAAAITLSTQLSAHKATAAPASNPHLLPVAADTDADLLTNVEEAILAYLDFEPDQNRNGAIDGVELATLCAAAIKGLPLEGDAAPGETYRKDYLMYGLETCDQCGTQVNMGFFEVIVPDAALMVGCPLISLHYMEHGSFSYAGNVHNGRVDVPALVRALNLHLPFDPEDHQLPVSNDADADLLADKEEAAIGYRPFNPDQNRNEIPDGIELAQRCARVVAALPEKDDADPDETYKVHHLLRGLEACHVCGAMVNMGGYEIFNPNLNLKYPDANDPLDGTFLPELALHYMQHGSFDCHGQIHTGRVDIPRLLRTVDLRYPNDPNDHQLPIDANDLDGDLLADTEELTARFDLHDPDQDDNLTPDGIDLAEQCVEAIDNLPVYDPKGEGPPPATTYKIDYFQRGVESCHVCGANRNMGYWLVVNPALHLSIEVPDITCHYMHHGSFNYSGHVHGNGRIDVPLLAKILEMPGQCGHLGTIFLPADFNKDCREDFTDFADFADKWLRSTDPAPPDDGSPKVTYSIEPCDPTGRALPPMPEPTFTVRIDGPYVLFEDMVHGNCCPAKIEVNMSLEGNVIKLCEAEHNAEVACPCVCDWPADATLGPFEDGSYSLEVYKQVWGTDGELHSEEFKGSVELTIPPA